MNVKQISLLESKDSGKRSLKGGSLRPFNSGISIFMIALLLGCFNANHLHAQLVLNVDTTNELVWITGSDTGTPVNDDAGQISIVNWRTGVGTGGVPDNLDLSGAVIVSEGTECSYFIQTRDSGAITMEFSVDRPTAIDPWTITGTGEEVSYSSWSDDSKGFLADAIGSSMTIGTSGSGDDWEEVQIQAGKFVPDPIITIEKVLDTDTLIPDGSGDTFEGVDEPPALSDGTILASLVLESDTDFVEGIFSATVDGTIIEFARTDGAFPDGDGVVSGFGSKGYDISGGNVLFPPRRDSNSVRTLTSNFDGVVQTLVEHDVTLLPDGSGNFFTSLADTDPIALSGQNFVFEDTGDLNGIYAYIDGALVTIAQEGDAAPDGNTYEFGFDEPDIDGSNIVFEASTDNDNDLGGIYGLIDGISLVIADESETVPGQTDNFTSFDNAQIIGSTVIFTGRSDSLGEGFYSVEVDSGVAGEITSLVEEGDVAPDVDGLTFTGLDDMGIGYDGTLYFFESDLDTDTEDNDGIFAVLNGELFNVIDSTQTIDGKEIFRFDFISEGVDGNQVAFEVQFDDGSAGIYIATMTILGDVNRDGTVDLLDVAPFIDVLSTGSFQDEADLNQDGVVNLLDIEPLVNLLCT